MVISGYSYVTDDYITLSFKDFGPYGTAGVRSQA